MRRGAATRSRYLAGIAQLDIAKGGPLTIPTQAAVEPAPPVELTPEVPQHIAHTKLWPFFLKQRDQILKDKWNSSKDACYDIGLDRAIREWLQQYHTAWAAANPPPASP
jgi:hypothetical protein